MVIYDLFCVVVGACHRQFFYFFSFANLSLVLIAFFLFVCSFVFFLFTCTDNQWHFVAGRRQRTGTQTKLDIFVDGFVRASGHTSNTNPLTSSPVITIGSFSNVDSSSNNKLVAYVDDIQIYDVALSIDQLTAIMNTGQEATAVTIPTTPTTPTQDTTATEAQATTVTTADTTTNETDTETASDIVRVIDEPSSRYPVPLIAGVVIPVGLAMLLFPLFVFIAQRYCGRAQPDPHYPVEMESVVTSPPPTISIIERVKSTADWQDNEKEFEDVASSADNSYIGGENSDDAFSSNEEGSDLEKMA